jgi:hypothetical protein
METKVVKELDFAHSTCEKTTLRDKSILHNAGILDEKMKFKDYIKHMDICL